MKPNPMRKFLLLVGLLFAFLLRVSGQTYSIDWYKVSGGGGSSTGGVYTVAGTIGQHDAGGPMIGGGFSLTGGFWSLLAVQTQGAPLLNILRTTTNTVVVYWAFPSTGFRLQQNSDLGSPSVWSTPLETVNNNGTVNYIIVNPPAANRYYRLINP